MWLQPWVTDVTVGFTNLTAVFGLLLASGRDGFALPAQRNAGLWAVDLEPWRKGRKATTCGEGAAFVLRAPFGNKAFCAAQGVQVRSRLSRVKTRFIATSQEGGANNSFAFLPPLASHLRLEAFVFFLALPQYKLEEWDMDLQPQSRHDLETNRIPGEKGPFSPITGLCSLPVRLDRLSGSPEMAATGWASLGDVSADALSIASRSVRSQIFRCVRRFKD